MDLLLFYICFSSVCPFACCVSFPTYQLQTVCICVLFPNHLKKSRLRLICRHVLKLSYFKYFHGVLKLVMFEQFKSLALIFISLLRFFTYIFKTLSSNLPTLKKFLYFLYLSNLYSSLKIQLKYHFLREAFPVLPNEFSIISWMSPLST